MVIKKNEKTGQHGKGLRTPKTTIYYIPPCHIMAIGHTWLRTARGPPNGPLLKHYLGDRDRPQVRSNRGLTLPN